MHSVLHEGAAMRGRPKAELVLSQSEREQLQALTLRRKTAQAVALRARNGQQGRGGAPTGDTANGVQMAPPIC